MGSNTISLVLYMAFFFGLMYFLIIRPQNKKNKQLADLRQNLQAGDVVVTIGGIVGKILSVKDDDIVIEVGASKTKLTFKKWAVSSVDSPIVADAEPVAVEAEPVEVEDQESSVQ